MLAQLNKWSPLVAILALATSVVVGGLQFWSSKLAQEAYDASMSFGKVSAEISWAQALNAYRSTDHKIAAWENKHGFVRGKTTASSVEELLNGLDDLNLPLEIVQLYKTRHNEYQTLVRLSEAYRPFAERLIDINLSLPRNAALPILFKVEEQFRRTFSPASQQIDKGTILSFRLLHTVTDDLLRLYICTSAPGTCNTAAEVKTWKIGDYSSGDEIRWKIEETGRYYLWSHKVGEEGANSTINEIVYSKDEVTATIIKFQSGLEIKASVLKQK